MRTQAVRLSLQTNKPGNQEMTSLTLLVHLFGDLLDDADYADKGCPSIGPPPGPSVQPNAPLSDHSCYSQ